MKQRRAALRAKFSNRVQVDQTAPTSAVVATSLREAQEQRLKALIPAHSRPVDPAEFSTALLKWQTAQESHALIAHEAVLRDMLHSSEYERRKQFQRKVAEAREDERIAVRVGCTIAFPVPIVSHSFIPLRRLRNHHRPSGYPLCRRSDLRAYSKRACRFPPSFVV